MRHDGMVIDPAMVEAIRIAFYQADVSIERELADIEDVDAGDAMVGDGWCVRPVR